MSTPEQVELADSCGAAAGHHRCLTHDKGFRNNMEATDHDREHGGSCRFAWSCPEHGLEKAWGAS